MPLLSGSGKSERADVELFSPRALLDHQTWCETIPFISFPLAPTKIAEAHPRENHERPDTPTQIYIVRFGRTNAHTKRRYLARSKRTTRQCFHGLSADQNRRFFLTMRLYCHDYALAVLHLSKFAVVTCSKWSVHPSDCRIGSFQSTGSRSTKTEPEFRPRNLAVDVGLECKGRRSLC